MTEEDLMGLRSRMERVTEMLRARTDADGNPKPGYKQNVAHVRAELAILQEQIDNAGVNISGK